MEDCRIFIENDKSDFVNSIYNELNLKLYKTCDSNKSLEFIKNTESIKICVSEYSDIIFNNYHPNYVNSDIVDSKFVGKNIVNIGNNTYSLVKNTSVQDPFHWLGYDLTARENTKIKFSFEMMVNRYENVCPDNFIGFKRHKPMEIIRIPNNKIILCKWIKYEFTFKITNNFADLYILIFDNAPQCDVIIKNFAYQISK